MRGGSEGGRGFDIELPDVCGAGLNIGDRCRGYRDPPVWSAQKTSEDRESQLACLH